MVIIVSLDHSAKRTVDRGFCMVIYTRLGFALARTFSVFSEVSLQYT